MEIKESSSAFLLMEYQDSWQTYSKTQNCSTNLTNLKYTAEGLEL
jgi:hypothetical protein